MGLGRTEQLAEEPFREKDKRRAGYGESGEICVERAEAKVFANRECYKNFFYHATSPKSLRQIIHVFRKLSGQTPYIHRSIGICTVYINIYRYMYAYTIIHIPIPIPITYTHNLYLNLYEYVDVNVYIHI